MNSRIDFNTEDIMDYDVVCNIDIEQLDITSLPLMEDIDE